MKPIFFFIASYTEKVFALVPVLYLLIIFFVIFIHVKYLHLPLIGKRSHQKHVWVFQIYLFYLLDGDRIRILWIDIDGETYWPVSSLFHGSILLSMFVCSLSIGYCFSTEVCGVNISKRPT